MADDSEYEIGLTLLGMETLQELGIRAPRCDYIPFVASVPVGDGTVRGVGKPATRWHWGFLRGAQRSALREFCAGSSSAVFIRSRADDNEFYIYLAIMVWPPNEELVAGRVLDFELEFRNMELVEIEASP